MNRKTLRVVWGAFVSACCLLTAIIMICTSLASRENELSAFVFMGGIAYGMMFIDKLLRLLEEAIHE